MTMRAKTKGMMASRRMYPSDRFCLLGVSSAVGAVEGEVPHGGKFGLDPLQPGGVVGRKTSSTSCAAAQLVTSVCLRGEKLSMIT